MSHGSHRAHSCWNRNTVLGPQHWGPGVALHLLSPDSESDSSRSLCGFPGKAAGLQTWSVWLTHQACAAGSSRAARDAGTCGSQCLGSHFLAAFKLVLRTTWCGAWTRFGTQFGACRPYSKRMCKRAGGPGFKTMALPSPPPLEPTSATFWPGATVRLKSCSVWGVERECCGVWIGAAHAALCIAMSSAMPPAPPFDRNAPRVGVTTTVQESRYGGRTGRFSSLPSSLSPSQALQKDGPVTTVTSSFKKVTASQAAAYKSRSYR